MKDDLWITKHVTEYVSMAMFKGSRPMEDMWLIEDRMDYIEKLFTKKFGAKRSSILIKSMKDYWRI